MPHHTPTLRPANIALAQNLYGLVAALLIISLIAIACGNPQQPKPNQSAPQMSYLALLQGSWETGEGDLWTSLIISGNEAMSNHSDEYGPDKISINGDTITYVNATLGGEPIRNKIIKLNESEFVEQALDGSYTNSWKRRQ
ncbi:MAG: hypothetical protein ACK4NS_07395 [Saprospiraceae bacterium]